MRKCDIDLKSLTKLPKRFLVENDDDKSVVIVSTKINKTEINSDKKWDKVNKIIENWARTNNLEIMSTGNCLVDMERDWYLKKSNKVKWIDKYIKLKNTMINKIGKYYKLLNYDNFPVDCKKYGNTISYYNDFSGEWVNFIPAKFTDVMMIDDNDEKHELENINIIDLCTFLDYLEDNYKIVNNGKSVINLNS